MSGLRFRFKPPYPGPRTERHRERDKERIFASGLLASGHAEDNRTAYDYVCQLSPITMLRDRCKNNEGSGEFRCSIVLMAKILHCVICIIQFSS